MTFFVDGTEYLSTKEAAERIGVHPNTLRRYTLDGTVKPVDYVRVGKRKQRGFTEEWVKYAIRTLDEISGGHS